MSKFEYKKELEIAKNYDVVVCGGGPAGICAAVAAARGGASVLLVERMGVLGGNLTTGQVCPILGAVSKGTMAEEVVSLLREGHDYAPAHVTRCGIEWSYDSVEAKRRLTKFVVDNKVDFMLTANVTDLIKDGNTVKGVIISSPSGLQAIGAKVVIDATGDGSAAACGGAEFKVGRDSDGRVQPLTLEFVIDNVDESVAITAWGGSDPVLIPGTDTEYRKFCIQKNAEGELPENVTIVRLHRTMYSGERSVNATQVNGIDPLDPADLAKAEAVLRSQIDSIITFLRNYIPGYSECREKSSSSVPGVRESRRIVGDATVEDVNVETGLMLDDAVVHNAWFLIDIHNPTGGGQAEGYSRDAKAYDIPYGALLVKNFEGLLTAGRCISGTHRAHASYRVMYICMATGQAAGVAASLAVKKGVSPRSLDVKDIRSELERLGVEL